jgi:DNA-binding PadR family transcriptional regulator
VPLVFVPLVFVPLVFVPLVFVLLVFVPLVLVSCVFVPACAEALRRTIYRVFYSVYPRWEDVMSVRHALLALLSQGPRYGLQLRDEFMAGTGEVWPLNVGQVYTTLQRLERDGLVESDEQAAPGPQNVFRITTAGAVELDGWLRTPPDLSSPPRDELVIKVLVSLRVPGTDPLEVIQVHRRYLVELMQQWTRLKEDESDLGQALVVDAELFRLDAVVRWLDAAGARIKRASADIPAPATPAPDSPAPVSVSGSRPRRTGAAR